MKFIETVVTVQQCRPTLQGAVTEVYATNSRQTKQRKLIGHFIVIGSAHTHTVFIMRQVQKKYWKETTRDTGPL